MIPAIILICASLADCTEQTAIQVERVRVPLIACGMASQTIIAAEAGQRAEGAIVKTICGRG
jgi:hypothetical protein